MLVTEDSCRASPGEMGLYAPFTALREAEFVSTVKQHSAPKRVGVHVVAERLVAVDLDDRDPLAVLALELRVARDVDLLELEVELGLDVGENAAGSVAEVAPDP
jgi:hypothetical protein